MAELVSGKKGVMKKFLLLFCVIALTSFQEKNENGFVLTISTENKIVRSYSDLKIEARIINKSGRDIFLIGNVDGAESKYRYPHIYFLFIGTKGDTLNSNFDACSNIDELKSKNFVMVKNDSVFNPFDQLAEHGYWPQEYFNVRDAVKGKYKVQLIYSTNCPDKSKWKNFRNLHTSMPEVDSLIDLVPKIELESNSLNILFDIPSKR